MRNELLSAHGLYAIACTILTLPDSSDADRASGLTDPTPLVPALSDDTIDIRFPGIYNIHEGTFAANFNIFIRSAQQAHIYVLNRHHALITTEKYADSERHAIGDTGR